MAITILPDKMSDQVKNLLLSFYSNKISEMPSKLANKLLVERTPKVPIFERQRRLQAMKWTYNSDEWESIKSGITYDYCLLQACPDPKSCIAI